MTDGKYKGKKLDAMHARFGVEQGKRCGRCPHFTAYRAGYRGDRSYYKCDIYGDSASEATDWGIGYEACGLINDPGYSADVPIYQTLKSRKAEEETVPGQMGIWDLEG